MFIFSNTRFQEDNNLEARHHAEIEDARNTKDKASHDIFLIFSPWTKVWFKQNTRTRLVRGWWCKICWYAKPFLDILCRVMNNIPLLEKTWFMSRNMACKNAPTSAAGHPATCTYASITKSTRNAVQMQDSRFIIG